MKTLFFVLSFAFSLSARADSFPVSGVKADALVDAFVALGLDEFGTHEYFQTGVSACAEVFDDEGGYFPGGRIGDYQGEACMIYGNAPDSDPDGVLRVAVSVPADDPGMTSHAELKAKLEKLRALRLAMEAIVKPLVRTVSVEGRDVVIQRTSGFAGIACEGRDARGVRQCRVLPSHVCPPLETDEGR